MVTPTIVQCQDFLYVTTKFDNIEKTYANLCKLMPSLISFNDRNKQHIKKLEEKQTTGKEPVTFESKEQMIEEAKKFFIEQGGEFAEIAKVFNNPEIKFNINVIKVGYCTSYTTMDSDYKTQHNLNVTLDQKGLLALKNEMVNAYAMSKARENEREQDKDENHLMYKTTNMFISTLIIDRLTRNSNLSPEARDLLKYSNLKELEREVNYLMADTVLYKKALEACPEIFESTVNNISAENFLTAIKKMVNSSLDPSLQEAITNRINDIAMSGNTARYIQGNTALTLGYLKNNEVSNKYIMNRIQNTAINTAVRESMGEETRDMIIEGYNAINDPTEDLETLLNDPSVLDKYMDENVMIRYKKPSN